MALFFCAVCLLGQGIASYVRVTSGGSMNVDYAHDEKTVMDCQL